MFRRYISTVGKVCIHAPADYSQVATGAARSSMAGSLYMAGNNVLENIIIPYTPASASEAVLLDGTNHLITGSRIGTAIGPTHRSGISTIRTQLSIIDCEIFATNEPVSSAQSNVTIQNSLLSTDSTFSDRPSNPIIGLGVYDAPGTSVTTIRDSTIRVNAVMGNGIGILASANGLSQANNVQVDVMGPNSTVLQAQSQATNIVTNSSLRVGPTGGLISRELGGGHVTVRGSTCNVNGIAGPCPT